MALWKTLQDICRDRASPLVAISLDQKQLGRGISLGCGGQLWRPEKQPSLHDFFSAKRRAWRFITYASRDHGSSNLYVRGTNDPSKGRHYSVCHSQGLLNNGCLKNSHQSTDVVNLGIFGNLQDMVASRGSRSLRGRLSPAMLP